MMKKPICLIAGVMTSGKTTLARFLVSHGVYDFMIEVDTIKEWTDGHKMRLGKLWIEDPPKARQLTRAGNVNAGILAAAYPGTLVMSGVWPQELTSILERVQDWRLIVLKTPTKDEAWARWLNRKLGFEVSGDNEVVKKIKYDFDNAPWGVDEWWVTMRERMTELALYAHSKGKLIRSLSEILSEDQLVHDDFQIVRLEQIPEAKT
jgi:hypothetical protein